MHKSIELQLYDKHGFDCIFQWKLAQTVLWKRIGLLYGEYSWTQAEGLQVKKLKPHWNDMN